ncbi:MAG: DsbA family protein [Bacteroidota bacterium]
MKNRFTVNTLLLLLFTTFFTIASACAQVDDSQSRKDRIKANLYVLFPQLETHSVEIGDFEEIGAPGVEMGSFVVDGQQQQPFIITDGDSKLFLLAGGPFDVSKTEDELAEQIAARKEAERQKAVAIHADLMPAVANLPYRGSGDAPVTIVEFSDFQCPYCARATDTMHKLIAKHAEDVRLVYMQFPLESIHPWARAASIASLCAANQSSDAFWTLHDKYFEDQSQLNADNLIEMSTGYLADSGIAMEQWNACSTDRDGEAYKAASSMVDAALQLGIKHGVNSTPVFFVNGQLVSGAQPLETFEAAIEAAME